MTEILAGHHQWVQQVLDEERGLLSGGADYVQRKAWVHGVRKLRQQLLQDFVRGDGAVFGALARMLQVDHPERPLLEVRARLRDGVHDDA